MFNNYLSSLEEFIQRWDDDSSSSEGDFQESSNGNINLSGSPERYDATIFTKSSPLFLPALEKGVRDLVILLVERFSCITYSSCEGHPPLSQNPLRQRHVGVLPRSREEYSVLCQIFREAAHCASSAIVKVIVRETKLESEEITMPCLDIVFVAPAAFDAFYFTELEKVHSSFVAYLVQSEPGE